MILVILRLLSVGFLTHFLCVLLLILILIFSSFQSTYFQNQFELFLLLCLPKNFQKRRQQTKPQNDHINYPEIFIFSLNHFLNANGKNRFINLQQQDNPLFPTRAISLLAGSNWPVSKERGPCRSLLHSCPLCSELNLSFKPDGKQVTS